ncbi:hypothetical protein ASE90_17095 [Sphingomonas sp. Leaf67]|uniref:hypothetical protein n=1 Tax=Sphingomonas sp. Leaf67 TaxID=1736230 RepID=UPI000701EEB6|nr:hypothetical protein [Sphingomonas sp. Leaf67]KQN90800.1 hypothetical protein ASE90_17095 [Sphingomonas sp. Leaf67]
MVSFAAWSVPVVVVGALAIAALLYALQRLRVHRRRVALAAAPLWLQAARAAPPRVLGGPFRRPLAFLLALAIALALWLAASRPEPVGAPAAGVHLFYLDPSALMTGGGSFAQARAALTREAAAVPARARTVYLGDADGTLLLAPGEDGALLPARLGDVRPGLYPSTFARWLATRDRGAPVTVHYFGHRAVFDAAVRPGGDVRVVPGFLADPVANNRGIVELGVSPAASGAWDRADVLVTLSDAALGADALRMPGRVDALGGGRFVVRDVPATGQTLTVALRQGDGFAADDRASILIPDRRPVRVAIGAGVPATIARAVRIDPAFRIVALGAAQVVIRTADASAPALPSLVLTDPAREAATFVVTTPPGEGDVALADRLDALGLRGIDAAGVADDLGRPVALREGVPAAARSVAAWRTLFAEQTGFARSPALPLFVSQTLRWLAAPTPWVPYAKAGARLPDQSALYGLAGDPALRSQSLGDGVYLSSAGPAKVAGRDVQVALADRETSRLASARPAAASPVDGAGGSVPDLLFPVLLLFAAVLLACEWRLFQRGWMP